MSDTAPPSLPDAGPPDAGPGGGPPDSGPPDAAGRVASGAGERTHPATPLVRLWVGVVAFAWFAGTEFLTGDGVRLDDLRGLLAPSLGLAVLGLGLVVGLGFGWWGWWTTTFHVTPDELRIENAGAFTQSRRIAYGRIQSVDVNQPFAARLLGLAELVIDVGGGGESTRLSYLGRRRAGELRDHLLARAHGVRGEAGPPREAASAWDDLAASDRVLVRLHPGEIIVAALLSLELLLLLGGFAIPLVVGVALGQPWLAIGGGLVPLALALWSFLARRVIGQFNHTLAATPGGLRVTRGLTTLQSQTVPLHRVQALQVTQPVLWRLIGRHRVDVSVLGAPGADGAGGTSTLLPVATREQVRIALEAVLPGLAPRTLALTPSPARARWLDPLAATWNGFGFDDRVLVARHGWFVRREFIVPHARLQSGDLVQGPVDRRLSLADVRLHTSGAVGRVVHMDAAAARALLLDELSRARRARAAETAPDAGVHPETGEPPTG